MRTPYLPAPIDPNGRKRVAQLVRLCSARRWQVSTQPMLTEPLLILQDRRIGLQPLCPVFQACPRTIRRKSNLQSRSCQEAMTVSLKRYGTPYVNWFLDTDNSRTRLGRYPKRY